MNKTLKVILIVVGVILVLCICGGVILFGLGTVAVGSWISLANVNASGNPAKVEAMAGQVADFSVPAGFSGNAAGFMGINMLVYNNNSSFELIMFMQLPSSVRMSTEEMAQSLYNNFGSSYTSGGIQFTTVEEKPIRIRGEQTSMVIAEGSNSSGLAFRRLVVPFQGKGGTAIVMIMAPLSSWNQATYESFLASLR
jgi:hypothetical protein